MAVYYKFKSAKDFDSISIDGHFISVANLKERIFESKLGRSTGLDLVVANAQTNEEYLDEATLIPKNTSLLVRRVPLQRRMTIVANPIEPKVEENNVQHEQPANTSFTMGDSSVFRHPEETEGDEFGNDLYAIPEATPVQSINMVQEAPAPDKADEDSKIRALIDSSGLDWQMQTQDGYGAGRGFGRGMGGRMTGGRGFGRGVGFERRTTTPPQGYICHRCEVPGHFIQHCPTNGDPTYDKKRVKNPTGIPKDMLVMNPYGQYALPGGNVAEMKPDEAAFDREVEGLSSTRSVGELPPELHCPLCKEVMKDAVLTSKCCFSSFCDKCIRNRIISLSMCVCGATNILADDLLPNKTVRDTINRILESNNSSTENAGSAIQVPDTASARYNPPKAPSPTVSASSKGGHMPPSPKKDTPDVRSAASGGQPVVNPPQQSAASGGQPMVNPPQLSVEKDRTAKAAELSEVTLESMHGKEPKLQGSVSHAEEEVQQKLPTAEPGKKKKKKKTVFPGNGMEQQWRMPQDFPVENHMMPFPVENHMMPFPYPTYDPYWGGMQMGMDGYMAPPYPGAMPYMGYAPGPFDVPFGGPQGYQMPVPPPQRDLNGGPGMGFNPASSISREEFEARKADLRRKHENDRRGHREFKDRENGREVNNNVDASSMKLKSQQRTIPPQGANGHATHPRESEPSRHGKSRAVVEHHHHDDKETAEHKASVFSRISFPEGGSSKKRKPDETTNNKKLSNGYKDSDLAPSPPPARQKPMMMSNGHHDVKKVSNGAAAPRKRVMMEEDSSEDDEERHFKRRPTRYEPQQMEWEEDAARRSSRESGRDHRDRGREHERDYERQRGHSRHSHR